LVENTFNKIDIRRFHGVVRGRVVRNHHQSFPSETDFARQYKDRNWMIGIVIGAAIMLQMQ